MGVGSDAFADGLFDAGGWGFWEGLGCLVVVVVVEDDGMDLSGFLFVDLVALEGIAGVIVIIYGAGCSSK